MKHNLVVTIGRQYGSGGREVGSKLAKLLNISYYDKELIVEASRMSGICSKILEKEDEKTPGTLSHALSMGFMFNQGLTPENLFKIQSDAIHDVAAKGPCVIVGRCADYVLRNNPLCFNIFVAAPEQERIERITKRQNGTSAKEAIDLMQKIDKNRASYYNFYTNKDWGWTTSYHLTIDSSLLGINKTAEQLRQFVLAALDVRGGSF